MVVNRRRDRRCGGRRLGAVVYGRDAGRGGLDCRGIDGFGWVVVAWRRRRSGCRSLRSRPARPFSRASGVTAGSPQAIARPSARRSLCVPAALCSRTRIWHPSVSRGGEELCS